MCSSDLQERLREATWRDSARRSATGSTAGTRRGISRYVTGCAATTTGQRVVESATVQQAWRIPSKLPAARSSEKACSPLTAPPPDGGDTVMGGMLALGAGAGDGGGADEDPDAAPESEALRLIPGAPDAVEASQVRSPDPPAPALFYHILKVYTRRICYYVNV